MPWRCWISPGFRELAGREQQEELEQPRTAPARSEDAFRNPDVRSNAAVSPRAPHSRRFGSSRRDLAGLGLITIAQIGEVYRTLDSSPAPRLQNLPV